MVHAVLVTGASTGLGLETAMHLAEHGLKVYATILNLQDRDAIEVPARKRGVKLHVLQLDITDQKSIDSAVQAIIKESGGIYGLVNNAGTRLRGCFEDLADKEIRYLYNTNLFGTMAVTRAVLPYMRAAHRGRIVMLTSIAGKIGSFGVSAYCSTKFAQEGFGESLAQEVLPFGIRVIMVEPAIIKTEAWSRHRVIAAGANNQQSPYYNWFHKSERLADKLVESSPTKASEVSRTICKALTIKRPRLRYMVGSRAKLLFILQRYLPGELFERIYFPLVIRKVTSLP